MNKLSQAIILSLVISGIYGASTVDAAFNGVTNTTGTATATGSNSIAAGSGATAQGIDSIALGNSVKADSTNTLVIGVNSNVQGATETSTSNSVAIGFENQIKNGARESVAIGANNTLNVGNNGSVGLGYSNTISGSEAISIGYANKVTANKGIVIGDNAEATSTNSIALGADSKTGDTSSLSRTAYLSQERFVTTNGVLSVGAAGKTRRITNVAGGSADTDAVNVAQLKASQANLKDVIGGNASIDSSTGKVVVSDIGGTGANTISGAIQNNTNDILALQNKSADYDSRISENSHEIKSVGASAAALAGLHPLSFDPDDKANFAVAGGFYKGEKSVALGAFYRPNEETMLNLATTLGNSDNMVNMGVSFKVGDTKHERKIKEQYKTAPISTVYVLEDEVSGLKAENTSQKQEIAQLKAKSEQQEALIQKLIAKVGI